MLIIFGSSLAFSAITNYIFYHQEFTKSVIKNVPFSHFLFNWGFDLSLIARIFVYALLYALSIYFKQFGFTLIFLFISKFHANFTWQYHHLAYKGKK